MNVENYFRNTIVHFQYFHASGRSFMDSIFETGFTFQSLPIQTYFPDFIIRYTIYYIVTAYLMHNKIFYLYNICLNISRLTDREPYV